MFGSDQSEWGNKVSYILCVYLYTRTRRLLSVSVIQRSWKNFACSGYWLDFTLFGYSFRFFVWIFHEKMLNGRPVAHFYLMLLILHVEMTTLKNLLREKSILFVRRRGVCLGKLFRDHLMVNLTKVILLVEWKERTTSRSVSCVRIAGERQETTHAVTRASSIHFSQAFVSRMIKFTTVTRVIEFSWGIFDREKFIVSV